eukprot:802608_1
MMLSFFVFSILFRLIKTQSNAGYAQIKANDYVGGPNIDMLVVTDGSTATIDLCGDSIAWFGVGFNTTEMEGSYAIIVYTDGDGGSINVVEYTLSKWGRGSPVTTSTITVNNVTITDGRLCVTATRNAESSLSDIYSFPN